MFDLTLKTLELVQAGLKYALTPLPMQEPVQQASQQQLPKHAGRQTDGTLTFNLPHSQTPDKLEAADQFKTSFKLAEDKPALIRSQSAGELQKNSSFFKDIQAETAVTLRHALTPPASPK